MTGIFQRATTVIVLNPVSVFFRPQKTKTQACLPTVMEQDGDRIQDNYRSRHVKDPGHSAKSAGGWLQLNTHAP